jgi:hypothetical protein
MTRFVDSASASYPDGGCLAWTIVAASFMVSFLQDGFRDSFGLILPTISSHFNIGRAEADLMHLPAMDIVEVYLSRNLGLATGIAAAGSGFGQFVLAPAIHVMEDTFWLEGTFYTRGAVVSSAVFFALIYRKKFWSRSGK